MKKILILAILPFIFTSCAPSEATQNQRLAKACQAGISALLAKDSFDRQISIVKNKKFNIIPEGHEVILEVQTRNKSYGYNQDEAFTCVFDVSTVFGPFGERIELVQANIGDTNFGKKDGQILGDMKDFLLITESVQSALN